MDIYERLRSLNIELPPAPPPGGLYAPVKLFGANLAYTSGVGPTDQQGNAVYSGKVGSDLTLEEGQADLQYWYDNFTTADIDVTVDGGYIYTGDWPN